MGPLWPTLLTVVALVTAMAALPWLLRRFQQRTAALRGAAGLQSRVLGAVGVGPQQRVVTVEVGEGAQTVRLVLGVTAQSRSEEHTSELQSQSNLVCRLLLEK